MEEKIITIDINKLDTDELKALAKILYDHGYMRECDDCNKRYAWIMWG